MGYTNGAPPYEVIANGNGSSHAHESNRLTRASSRKDLKPLLNAANKFDSEAKNQTAQSTWYPKSPDENVQDIHADQEQDVRVMLQLKRENTVKDLTQKLAAQHLISANASPAEEKVSRFVLLPFFRVCSSDEFRIDHVLPRFFSGSAI